MYEINSKKKALEYLESCLSSDQNIIPYLPQVLVRVQKAINDQNVGAKELAKVILDDPSLTARVLRLANSVYYRQSARRIKTVTSAIVLLGFETIRNVVLGLSVYNMFNNLPRIQSYRNIWRHSLCCAVCSQQIGAKIGLPVPEEAFVGGLLHDIGKFILGQFFPNEYRSVIQYVREKKISYLKAEKKFIKCTHLEAGRLIAVYWGFPDEITSIIEDHEMEENIEKFSSVPFIIKKIVIIANKIANYVYPIMPLEENYLYSTYMLAEHGIGISREELASIVKHLKNQVYDIAKILDIVIDEWKYEQEENKSKEGEENEKAPKTSSQILSSDSTKERLELMVLLNKLLIEEVDLPQLLKKSIKKLCDALHIERIILLFLNKKDYSLEPKFGYGLNLNSIWKNISISLNEADEVAAYCYLTKKIVKVEPENLHLFTRISSSNLISLLGTINIVALPIFIKDKINGVMIASRPNWDLMFTDEEIQLLDLYTRNISKTISQSYGRISNEK